MRDREIDILAPHDFESFKDGQPATHGFPESVRRSIEQISPASASTKLSSWPSAQLESRIRALVQYWIQQGVAAEKAAQALGVLRQEIAYTLFCYRAAGKHPSGEDPQARLKTLFWLFDYLS